MNKSFQRSSSERVELVELRLPEIPLIPDRVVRAFPELAQYNSQSNEWYRKSNEQIRQAIERAQEQGSDYVALFEANL